MSSGVINHAPTDIWYFLLTMNYPQALQYLYSFFNLERVSRFSYQREFNLKRMSTLLNWFGHPEKSFRSILIAGTKGKGSTAYFLHSILAAHRLKVGLYTSPHLSDFRERIRVNSRLVSRNACARLVKQIKLVIERRSTEIRSLGPITFFEVSTLLAILYFAEQKVRWAILEVGMGGRLDATNSIRQALSVFTLIGRDHQEYLGNTVSKIAREKAAIIKSNTPFVSAKQTNATRQAIFSRAKRFRADGYFCGTHFHYRTRHVKPSGSQFDFLMGSTKILNIAITLPGLFQIENASLAIAAALVLKKRFQISFDPFLIRKGLKACTWPGRFEVIGRKGRTFILDGAHNIDSMRALERSIQKLFPRRAVVTVFGVSREKEIQPMLEILSRFSKVLIATKSDHPRAQITKRIVEAAKEAVTHSVVIPTSDTREAMDRARRVVGKEDLILVTGSLFLVGEIRRKLKP